MSSLCNGDVHRPIRIEIFDWDSNGKHQSMGQVQKRCQVSHARACFGVCMSTIVFILSLRKVRVQTVPHVTVTLTSIRFIILRYILATSLYACTHRWRPPCTRC
jgi:hypothetical protein